MGYDLLLLRRKPSERDAFAGHVCFPGGRIEKGENHIEAAIRETKEEAGIVLNEKEHLIDTVNRGFISLVLRIKGKNIPYVVTVSIFLRKIIRN